MSDKRQTIKTVIIVLFVALCAFAYLRDTANEAKSHSQGDYEKYQEEMAKEYEEQAQEYELQHWLDGSLSYEEVAYEPYSYVGSNIKLDGPVADVSLLNNANGSPSFIDIGEAYPNTERVTIVVWEEHYDEVSAILNNININDLVIVEGIIEIYDGVAQIEVTDSSQIYVSSSR